MRRPQSVVSPNLRSGELGIIVDFGGNGKLRRRGLCGRRRLRLAGLP
jgi:hypothetical protein